MYHAGPIMRAVSRMKDSTEEGCELGGPGVHLVAHLIVISALAMTALGWL